MLQWKALLIAALLVFATSLHAQDQVLELCEEPASEIDDAFPTTTEVITFDDDGAIVDVTVSVDISHSWIGSLIVDIQSPVETLVTLHDRGGLLDEDIIVTWGDSGDINDAPYDCDCDMLPSGPGLMEDFVGEALAGDWTLSVTDVEFEFIVGTLNSWCVEVTYTPSSDFKRGDANADGDVSGIADALVILEWQFNLGDPPPCVDAADVDDDGAILALLDVVHLLSWQFLSGPDPVAPGVDECGEDPTADELSCAESMCD